MIFKFMWRNLWRNRRRTLITASSVAFSVFFAITMHSFKNGIFNHLINNLIGTYFGPVQIHAKGYWDEQVIDSSFPFTDSLRSSLDHFSDSIGFIPRLETFILASAGEKSKGAMLVGTDLQSEKNFLSWTQRLIDGRWPAPDEEAVILGEGIAKKLKLTAGDTLVLFGQGYQGTLAAGKYHITGLVRLPSPQMNDYCVFMPLRSAAYLLNADNRITTLVAIPLHNVETESLLLTVKRMFLQNFEIMEWPDLLPEISHHIEADTINTYIFTGVLYMIIAFGFLGTLMMMMAERKPEFGMLMAIGMKKKQLALLLTGESLLLSVMGVMAGIALSYGVVTWFAIHPIALKGSLGQAYEQFGFEPVLPTEWSVRTVVIQAGIVCFIAFCSALYPVLSIFRLKEIEAIKK